MHWPHKTKPFPSKAEQNPYQPLTQSANPTKIDAFSLSRNFLRRSPPPDSHVLINAIHGSVSRSSHQKGEREADDCLHGVIDRGHTASICRRRFPRLSSKDDTPRPRRSSGTAQVATPKAALVRPDSPENDPSDEFRPMVEYGPQTRRPVEGYLATCPRGASAGHGRRRARQASPASDNRDPERTEMVSPRRDPLSGFLGNSECDRV